MATKKKAAKKTAKKKTAKKRILISPSLVLKFDPRIKGDPPPIWFRQLDAVRQKELQAWVNAVVQKVGR
jgi:hypothetical protein